MAKPTRIRVAFYVRPDLWDDLRLLVAQIRSGARAKGQRITETPSMSDIAERGIAKEVARLRKQLPPA